MRRSEQREWWFCVVAITSTFLGQWLTVTMMIDQMVGSTESFQYLPN